MEFDADFTEAWMRRFATAVAVCEDQLTDLDQRAGDGDFGVNLSAGLESAVARLDVRPPGRSAAGPLDAAATAFLDDVGGTSGPLFGLLLAELAAAAAGRDPLTTRALADGAEAGLAAVQRVGEARPGDKTLVDALAPAAATLRGLAGTAAPDRALSAAAAAAWDGVRRTARLRARRGRASYLGDRATGIPDPGAVGIALLFASAVDGSAPLSPTDLDERLGGTEPMPAA